MNRSRIGSSNFLRHSSRFAFAALSGFLVVPIAQAQSGPSLPAPAPSAPADDVTSVFSDAYDDIAGVDFNPNWGQSTVLSFEAILGDATVKYAGLDFQGIDFATNEQDVSDKDLLHLDLWTPDASAVNLGLVSAPGMESVVALPISTGTWVSVDIELSAFPAVDPTRVIQLKLDDAGTGEAATLYLDNIYFYRDSATAVPALGLTGGAALAIFLLGLGIRSSRSRDT